MCVICIKPVGSKFNIGDLRLCAKENKDRGGIMVNYPYGVRIWRFLDVDQIVRILKDNDHFRKYDAAIHFRIATSGGVNLYNAHPFAVSSDDNLNNRESGVVRAAIMHNGVMDGGDTAMSDTHKMALILGKLPHNDRLTVLNQIKGGQKFCYFGAGQAWRVGDFKARGGLWYSNLLWSYPAWGKADYDKWGAYNNNTGYQYSYHPLETKKDSKKDDTNTPAGSKFCESCGIRLLSYEIARGDDLCYSCKHGYTIGSKLAKKPSVNNNWDTLPLCAICGAKLVLDGEAERGTCDVCRHKRYQYYCEYCGGATYNENQVCDACARMEFESNRLLDG